MTPRSVAEVIVGGFHLDPVKATKSLQRLQSLSEEHNAELFCYITWTRSTRGSKPPTGTCDEDQRQKAPLELGRPDKA